MENKVKILIAENNEFGQNCVREFSSYGYNHCFRTRTARRF